MTLYSGLLKLIVFYNIKYCPS